MTPFRTKNIITSWLIISFFLFLGYPSAGQGMMGVVQSNYSTLPNVANNPAILTNTKNYLEINLLSINYFLWNDFAYIPSSDMNIWALMRTDGTNFPTYGESQQNFLYYRNRDVKNMSMNVSIMGPSVMYQRGKHGFAITTSFRYLTTGNNVPWEMPVMGYEGLNYSPIQNVNFNDFDFDFETQGWMEIGFSYAYDVYHKFDNQITVGISLKSLFGYAGVVTQIKNVDYIILNDSTINFKNLNGQMAYAIPVNYQNNDFPMNDPFFKGNGVGADVGVVYTKRRYIDDKKFEKACDQRFEDYVYRIGLSILDIGNIKYKHNAAWHSYDDVSRIWQNFDTISYTNINQVAHELSEVFYGDPNASYRGSEFSIGLPMAISVQVDYHVPKKEAFYISAFWVQPIRFNLHSLRRPAQLAIIPRYETKNIEVSVPLSLYEYKYPRIGLAVRFGFFSIGTDKLGTYLGLGDIDGLDFYASLRFNFGKGTCKNKIPSACENSEFGYSDKEKSIFRK